MVCVYDFHSLGSCVHFVRIFLQLCLLLSLKLQPADGAVKKFSNADKIRYFFLIAVCKFLCFSVFETPNF